MNRRTFFATFAVAGVALAQEAKKAKEDRLSGRIVSIDKNGMSLEMHTNANPNVKRKIMWTADTKIMSGDKAMSADDLKEGARIVAVGKFQGTDLAATKINLPPRP